MTVIATMTNEERETLAKEEMERMQGEISQMIDLEDESEGEDDGTETNPPGTKAPATKAPTTDPPNDSEDELTRVKRENEELRQKLTDKDEKKPPVTKAPTTKAPTTDAPIEEVDFLSEDDDLYDYTNDKDKLNKLLNKVYQSGVKSARSVVDRLAKQPAVRSDLPTLVRENVNIALAMKQANEDFYSTNPDLEGFKKAVATVYGELAEGHPDWTLEQTLEETGKEARKRLSLPTPKQQQNEDADRNKGAGRGKGPNLPPGTKGGRKGKGQSSKKSSLLSEIDEMNSTE